MYSTALLNSLDAKTADLSFEILVDTFPTAFSAKAAVFHAAKGCGGRRRINVVDANYAELQSLKKAHGLR